MQDHELYIYGASPTTMQLTLARENGKALYSVAEINAEHQEELRFTQRDWMGGHGARDFDREPDRYFEGQSIDTTQNKRVFLGPLIHLIQENDDTALDSAPLGFKWFNHASKFLCWTTSKVYIYAQDDTGIDTDEALDATETGVDCDADASTAIPVGSIIHCENEEMYVTATGTTLTVVRGFRGTTAASHATNIDLYIYKWQAATTALSGVTDMCEYNGVMYAARGASTTYSTSTDGDTWTATDLTDDKANGFIVCPNPAATLDVLRKFKTPNEVCYTDNGAAGGTEWSSPAYIGDTSDNITNMFYVGDKLMVGREDNLYYYTDTGGVRPNMQELLINRDANNFKYVTTWKNSVYFSLLTHLGELTSYDEFDDMGPLTEIDDIDKVGTCVGLTSDKEFIYAVWKEGSNYVIYKGRQRTSDYGLRWEWCPFVYLSTNSCSCAEIVQHSATDKRLWFGYGTKTGFVMLSDDPTADSDYRYASSGWLRMSYIVGTDQYWDKLFQSVITETEDCAAGITVTPYYRKDTDSSASALTSAITTNGTVKTNLTSELSCNKIQFQLNLATNNSASTPQVKYFQARGVEKPECVRIHECTYTLGTTPSRIAQETRDFLRTGRTTTKLIKFCDLRYSTQGTGGTKNTDYVYCTMMPGYPEEIEIYHEKYSQPEKAIRIRLREVSF